MRNFTYSDINTLAACPMMPYHDPERPYVNAWFASSEGARRGAPSTGASAEANQDRLEAEGGACIMYTHFASGFWQRRRARTRGSGSSWSGSPAKNGWFVPVTTLLDYLAARSGETVITAAQRRGLERRWLLSKLRVGHSDAGGEPGSAAAMCDHDRVTMRAVERLSRFVPRGDLSRGVLTLVAGTGMAQLIVILSSPVLTRLYPPSDYGVYSVAMSIVAVLITIACLRYEFAIPLPGSDVTAANVLVLALATALVMSAIAGVVLWLTGPALLAVFGASCSPPTYC